MPEHLFSEISQAVFHTLLYSDVFDYPLTASEVHRYLTQISATYEDVWEVLNENPQFIKRGDYFALTGRESIVPIRARRTRRSQELLPYAIRYGRVLGCLPFVRMVTLTGSLAVMNISQNADFDYMLVTSPGRLWTARAFVLLFGRCTKIRGHTICPNLIVSTDSLEWHRHDLYSARELCQMIPITGKDVYQKLMQANAWIRDVLPNAYQISNISETSPGFLRRFLEFPLLGKPGDRLERWEMNRKIARFAKQEGFGDETVFNTQMCQGNFDHHRHWTEEAFRQRRRRFREHLLPAEEGIRVTGR